MKKKKSCKNTFKKIMPKEIRWARLLLKLKCPEAFRTIQDHPCGNPSEGFRKTVHFWHHPYYVKLNLQGG